MNNYLSNDMIQLEASCLIEHQLAPLRDIGAILRQVDVALAGGLVILPDLDSVVGVAVDRPGVAVVGGQTAIPDDQPQPQVVNIPQRQRTELIPQGIIIAVEVQAFADCVVDRVEN